MVRAVPLYGSTACLCECGEHAQRLDQLGNLSSGHLVQIGLHDHRGQLLIDRPSAFQQRREDEPNSRFWIRNSRSQQSWTAPGLRAIAMRRTVLAGLPGSAHELLDYRRLRALQPP